MVMTTEDSNRIPNVCPWCLCHIKSSLKDHIVSKHHKGHILQDDYIKMKKEDPQRFSTEMSKLNKQGRLRHNLRALELKDRKIIPARRASKTKADKTKLRESLVWCTLCRTVLNKKGLRDTHLKVCSAKKSLQLTKDNTLEITRTAELLLEPEAVTMQRLLKDKSLAFQEVLFDLTKDRLAITNFVVNDPVAHALLDRLTINGSGKNFWKTGVRKRLRVLFYTWRYCKAVYGDKVRDVMDMLDYSLWHEPQADGHSFLINCLYEVCGYDPKTKTFKLYNDVMTFSSVLKEYSNIIEFQMHHRNPEERLRHMTNGNLLTAYLHSDAWKCYTVRLAARQKAKKLNFKTVMVPVKDYITYLAHAEKLCHETFTKLKDNYQERNRSGCITYHQTLIGVLPTAIGAFSARRVSEPFVFTVEDFVTRPDMDQLRRDYATRMKPGALAETERYIYMTSFGKGSNRVSTIVKVEFLEMLELLTSDDYRDFMEVPPNNRYLFPSLRSTSGFGHANPSRWQSKLAVQVKDLVEDHTKMRTRHFRMTFSTTLGGLNLTYKAKKLLCALLGHSLDVHERSYNVPESLQVTATMGFATRMMGEDKLKNMTDQTIEDMLNKNMQNAADNEDGNDGNM
jgi:hypothetical protein